MSQRFTFYPVLIFFLFFLASAAESLAQPVFTIQNKKDACDGQSNGSFEILVTSGSGTISGFVFSSGPPIGPISLTQGVPQTVSGLSGLVAGKPYLVVVADDNGNAIGSVIIFLYPNVTASLVTAVNSSSCLVKNGSIDISVGGGSGAFTYSWTATNGFTATTQDISGLAAGDYTVVVSDPATTCSQTLGPITITEPVPPANASISISGLGTICNGQSTTLSVTIAGGASPYTVAISGLPVINNYISGTAINVAPTVTTSYSILTVTDANGCDAVALIGNPTITVNQPVNAGTNNTISACNNNGSFNLFASLGGTPDAGGTWTQLSGPSRTISGDNVDLIGAPAGAYTFEYKVTALAPCIDATAVVTVNVTAASNAGNNNTVDACNTDAAFNLFTSLGGTPDAVGTWTQLTGAARTITGNTVNLVGATAGAYTFEYKVLGTAPCPDATAVVTVNVITAPNAGTNNTVSACNNNGAFDLFASLGGTPDAGGGWTQLSGPSRTITGDNVDLNGAAAGTYTFEYEVTGAGPCADATAIVTVTVIQSPNAGVNNTVNACNTDAAFNLFTSLGGTPDAVGTWTQLTGAARTITGNTVNLVGATAGAYTFEYKVLGTAPCPDATAVVTVNVITAPNAGTNNTVSACNNNGAFDLFSSLGGTPDAGGSWTQLSGPSRTITGNNVDLNGAAAGTYTFEYEVAGVGPCADATAVVTVTVIQAPNAGINNAVSACNTEAAFNLFTSLSGTPDAGGVFTQLTGPARTITGNTVNLVGATAGAYTFEYKVLGTVPCPDATAVVTVNVSTGPNAGTNNTVSACNNNGAFDLFASLGGTPDAGGSWTQLSGPSRTITGNNVDLNGAVAGTYTFEYEVTGAGPCADATAVVTVTVIQAPNAGINNTVSACNTEVAFNLFTSLSGAPDAGGVFTQLTGPTLTITGNTVNLVGTTAGAYTFEYKVLGTAPCADATSVVTVNVIAAPNAGSNNSVNACSSDPNFNLFTSLAGTPDAGGTWTQLSGPSRTITGNTVDLNGAAAGIYTFEYRVTGTAPCLDATAIVTVNVSATPSAGVNSSVNACNTDAAFDLFASLSGSPDAGGSWTQLSGPARTITGNTVNLNGAAAGTYTFEYKVAGIAPCPDATSIVTIVVSELPNAGANNTVNGCNNDSAFNLFSSLGGTPNPAGTWTQLTGPVRTITGNTVDLNGAIAGAYTFEYKVLGVAPCPDATAVLTVNVNAAPNAGANNSVNACNTESAFDLFTSLGGLPQVGGIWTQLSGSLRVISGNTVNLSGASAGVYSFQYNVAGVAPCPNASAIVTVTVVEAPNAGSNNTVDACNTDSAFNLFTSLGGSPQAGGAWLQLTGPTRTVSGNTVDLNGASTGTYTFEYRVTGTAPCADATAVVTVQVSGNPDNSLSVTVSLTPVCVGGSSDIVVANSEAGVSYQLRNNADNSLVGTPVTGNGGSISLPTGALSTTTNFNVLATRATCSIQLLQLRSVTVFGVIDPSLPVSAQTAQLCEGSSTNIQVSNTEAGVLYQLRDDADNSLVGLEVSGTGGTINLPTGNLNQTKTFNVLAYSVAFCSIELNTKVTVQVDLNPDANLPLSAAITSLCEGGSTQVTIPNSQSGVSYQLRNDLDDSVIGSAVAGTGGSIDLPTGVLNANTTFNVLATSGVCSPVQMVSTVTVNVAGTINLTLVPLPVIPSLCGGSGTDIQIASSEVGVNYQLVDDSDNSLVGALVAGTGGTINLPTGNLSATKTYRVSVSSGTCSAELSTTATVNVTPFPSDALIVNAASAICSATSTSVEVVNSEVGIIYQLRDDTDDSNVSGAVFGNGGTINLPTGPLSSAKTFNVLATNGSCSVELVNKVSIAIDPAPSVTPAAVAQDNPVCSGTSTFVQVLNSEPGIIYQLRDNSDNSNVSGAVFGNGATINLPTGPLTVDRSFNVLASNSICSTQLTNIVSITVRAANDPACSNCSTVVISTTTTRVTCGATVPDGSVTFVLDPPVPVVNVDGVEIQITGPVNKTQLNDFVFTGLAVGNYTYVITYGDKNNPDCIKNGAFVIEAVREPDPITFDLTVDEFDCIAILGSITLDNIQGAANTDFTYVVTSGTNTIAQGTITTAQALSTFQIEDLIIGDYEIVLSQNQEAVNGCLGIANSQAISFSIQEPLGGCEIFIPNIFTPNGDGSNDTFFIRHLPENASVIITNRWGKEVYSNSDYKNDWTAENVSDGVYYYKIIAEAKSYTGWVEILR